MAGPDRRSIGIERRESMRLSLQSDDDDNTYDLDAMGVSDGFRPSEVANGHTRMTSQSSQPQGRRTPPPRPSSTAKPRYDSFALRHDGAMGPLASRNPTVAPSHAPTRSSSVSTVTAQFVRPESPYQGPSGPSHPYQMYPQESRLARTASIATTSTVPFSERSYDGPSGPTHPYGMYPQNIVPEAEDSDEQSAIATVPVGFPGLTDNYQRRLGPEGEEIADIIGPDGHTEQLPPYTQYPEEAFARKTRPAVETTVAGAGGMGLATRNPEFASREDLNTPQSRQSNRSFMSDSSHQINTAALGVSEKPELKKWQKIMRKKACGVIPVWAFLLVGIAVVLVLFGIILGSVLATLRSKHHLPKSSSSNNNGEDGYPQSIIVSTMTTTFDATPLTTFPTGIPTLPTGTFQVPVSTPSTAADTCLTDTSKIAAWSCAIAPYLPYQMSIYDISTTDPLSGKKIKLDYGNQSVDYLAYGAQPPVLNQPGYMRLVIDPTCPERGPAWFFQMPYDKVVIVPESQLLPPTTKRHTEDHDSISNFMGRKGVAQPGESPWLCYWNATVLEVFLYVNDTSSAGYQLSSSSLPGSYRTSAPPSSSTYTSSIPTSSVPPSSYSSGPDGDPAFLPSYPKVLKLEERRVPIDGQNPPEPQCIQYLVNEDGSYQPKTDANTGLPISIYLNETVSPTIAPMPGKRAYSVEERGSGPFDKRSNTVCGCEWLEQ